MQWLFFQVAPHKHCEILMKLLRKQKAQNTDSHHILNSLVFFILSHYKCIK